MAIVHVYFKQFAKLLEAMADILLVDPIAQTTNIHSCLWFCRLASIWTDSDWDSIARKSPCRLFNLD
jgi:hypothetical protein